MNIIPLWATAMAILEPFAAKAGEKVAEKTGEALYNSIEAWLRKGQDKPGLKLLKDYTKNPARHKAALQKMLEVRCADPAFAEYLRAMLLDGRASSDSVVQNVQIGSSAIVGDIVGKVSGDLVKNDKKTITLK